MSADKLAKALQRLIKANPVAMNNVQVDAAMEAHKALASHESEKQEPTVWIGKGQLREVLNGNAMSVYMIDKQDRFTDVPLYTSPQQEPDKLDAERWRNLCEIDGALSIFTSAYFNTATAGEFEAQFDAGINSLIKAKEAKP